MKFINVQACCMSVLCLPANWLLTCRIPAGGDKQSRQSRLGSDAADSFKQEDDALAKEDFSGFDKPTRIEGEGGHVDPDPGDRESVSPSGTFLLEEFIGVIKHVGATDYMYVTGANNAVTSL